jgi:hypothetical protein
LKLAELGNLVHKIRSKNAGPFWLTIDIFCGDTNVFNSVRAALTTPRVACVFRIDSQTLQRFEIPDLNVIKFSMPRPTIQGVSGDRDMHGASWAELLAELQLD